MVFSVKFTFIFLLVILLILLFWRKYKGLKGTWDSKRDIEEYAAIMNYADPIVLSPVKTEKLKSNNLVSEAREFTKRPLVKTTNFNSTESIGERICRKHLEFRFNENFSKHRPNFLKNPITGANLELDCFNPKLRLALEYNGKQHYDYVPKFHKNKNDLHNQKYRDEIKKRLCFENGVDLIEVPYTVSHGEIPIYIDSALEKLGRLKLL